ncbi:MAG: class I SAM-dependent methyltransferase [Desulfobacteraceae bacterium]|nr:class I SAM-dependent methyltransferase [Desulfobacteraceae bacterium]
MKLLDWFLDKVITGHFVCPVCQQVVRKFRPIPSYYLKNLTKYGGSTDFSRYETLNYKEYSCPDCGASDRDRLYALYLKLKFQDSSAQEQFTFIDFAPSGSLARIIRPIKGIIYRSADISMDGVDDQVDLMDLHIYPDRFCDFFICSHVLEHVPDDHLALKELYRILKPGGEGILMVPLVLSDVDIDEDPEETREAERWRRFGQGDHIRLYSKKGYLNRLHESGFQVKELGVDFFGSDQFDTAAITKQSMLYVVTKN